MSDEALIQEGEDLLRKVGLKLVDCDEAKKALALGERCRSELDDAAMKHSKWQMHMEAVSCMISHLGCYHGIRSGQRSLIINSSLKLLPRFFVTPSLNYQAAAARDAYMRMEMPIEAYEMLLHEGLFTVNLIAVDEHGNLGAGEALEMRIIRVVKELLKKMSP